MTSLDNPNNTIYNDAYQRFKQNYEEREGTSVQWEKIRMSLRVSHGEWYNDEDFLIAQRDFKKHHPELEEKVNPMFLSKGETSNNTHQVV